MKRGFTLIEILVVMSIFIILAAVGTNMFFTVLKGSAKTRVLAEVKQNGDYAISVMERVIRNAKSLSGGGASVEIINPDDSMTTFTCSDNQIVIEGSGSLISENVEVTGCSGLFNVIEGEAGVKPTVVTIDFTLAQADSSVRPEEQAMVEFRTTVALRNY